MNLDTVRGDIATALQTISGLQVYKDEPGAPQVPCAIVTVDHIDPHATLDGGVDAHLKIVVLVQLADWPTAQQALDAYITTGTPTSIADAAEKAAGENVTCTLVQAYGKATIGDATDGVTYGSATFDAWILG